MGARHGHDPGVSAGDATWRCRRKTDKGERLVRRKNLGRKQTTQRKVTDKNQAEK